jgi:hypothetical protein
MMKKICILFLTISSAVFSQTKINGISFVASNREITNTAIEPVIAANANWVTLMPFAFMKTISDTSIAYNDKRQWWGERKIGIEKTAESFHKKNIKIMLKPQIWIPRGFTGHIKMKSEADWVTLEKNYETFIIDYAKLAQSTRCEIFCIGTELNNFVVERPSFWAKLVTKIKKTYSGKITYAENWDTYQKVAFLSELDYIGIDAYFPLTTEKTPTIRALSNAWKPIKKEIEALSKKYKKPILFTEYGYQSKDFTAQEPWVHNNKSDVNLVAQTNALAVILAQFWKKDWFAGGFIWKWYDNHNESGGTSNTDYTIQNKPSEKIVAKFYK